MTIKYDGKYFDMKRVRGSPKYGWGWQIGSNMYGGSTKWQLYMKANILTERWVGVSEKKSSNMNDHWNDN